MTNFSKNFKELFSFTRNERIAVAILIVILLAIFLYPHFTAKTAEPDDGFEEFKAMVDEFEKKVSETEPQKNYDNTVGTFKKRENRFNAETFDFDPNTADENIFMRLGFSQKQAAAIINYRSKGAKFKTADDFKKIYVVSDDNFARLKDHIKIVQSADIQFKTPEKSFAETDNLTNNNNAVAVEINSADTTELKKLKGIGSYYARQIVEYRKKLGGFTDISQLKEIRGIDAERFVLFEKQAKADVSFVKKLNINSSTAKELAKHPYIGSYTARGIEQYRKIAGEIETLQQLVNEKIITGEQAEKLHYYIEF